MASHTALTCNNINLWHERRGSCRLRAIWVGADGRLVDADLLYTAPEGEPRGPRSARQARHDLAPACRPAWDGNAVYTHIWVYNRLHEFKGPSACAWRR